MVGIITLGYTTIRFSQILYIDVGWCFILNGFEPKIAKLLVYKKNEFIHQSYWRSGKYELLGEAFTSKTDVTAAQKGMVYGYHSDDVEAPTQCCPQLKQC